MNRAALCGLRGLAILAGCMGMTAFARADVTVTPTVSFDNGLYHYDYTVANNSADELAILTLTTLPGADTIQNLMAPDGFLADYDSGLGLVSFLEGDTGTFDPGSSVSGFSFDSPFQPGGTTFEALTIEGASVVGTTLAPAPEPGSIATLGALLATGAAVWRRRRRSALHG